MKAIETCVPTNNQFCSPIFLIKKPNGSFRFILNLKRLNNFVKTEHFKLEDYRTACKLIQNNDYLVSIDLKDAYYMINIDNSSKKYLRFFFEDKYYQFNVLPFGLCTAPLTFTKIMKPISAYLRERGCISILYIDDFLAIGSDYFSCLNNLNTTLKLLSNLGFIVNKEKCDLIPKQNCKFLGFIFNSLEMSISISKEKRQNCLNLIKELMTKEFSTIRFLAHVIGKLVAVCPAIKYGILYTKELERLKFIALKKHKDNYEAKISLNKQCKIDLKWWSDNILTASNNIRKNNYKLEIFSDASTTGWGASCGTNKTGGVWTEEELNLHINSLELKAAFFGLKCFASRLQKCEILLRIDNVTAISYINRLGGVQYPHLHSLAKQIWQWCETRDIYIFATYINTNQNVIADFESRKQLSNTEWEINNIYFQIVVTALGTPNIDLFATRTNKKCQQFVSWHPDPDALSVDAFTICWSELNFYAFPPFSMVLKTLEKVITDKAKGIVLVPYWSTQPWFPIFMRLLISEPVILGPSKDLLVLQNSRDPHPLHKNLRLMAGVLSGRPS